MRLSTYLTVILALGWALWVPLAAVAQPPDGEEEEEEAADADAEEAEGEEEGEGEEGEEEEEEGEEPGLRPPQVEPLEIEEEEEEEIPEDEFPSPGDAASQLQDSAPSGDSGDDDDGGWTAPQPVFTVHGYFRVRAELQDTFFLGRPTGSTSNDPFTRFRPIDNGAGTPPAGGCGDEPELDPALAEACSSETLGYANMRLRLEPTLSLSNDVRVHMQFDVFDNLVLGSTPDGLAYESSGGSFIRAQRTPRVPLDSFSAFQQPPTAYRNSLSDSIIARRAWAEVTNRDLGQLRFGRMPSHWGLGILANGGDGIDSDYQSDVDRIMILTKLAGFYLVAAVDFASEGFVEQNLLDLSALSYDATQEDDVDQYVFAVARRMDEEEQTEALQRGDWVLNAGAYFVYRSQFLSSQSIESPFAARGTAGAALVRREAEAFIPDLWVQFLWKKLRLEAEAVLIGGSIENTQLESFVQEDFGILQFGVAFEGEYRLLDDKLGIFFNTGFASGDSDLEGLSITNGLPAQNAAGGTTDDSITTMRLHPNYRVDLILWRNILTQIAGAYYFRPGISYDFIRNSFGQLFGARADFIYSRASTPAQTWGNDPNLGFEINASLYYRSEDGPELFDGFYGQLQYGILFPMKGLGVLENEDGSPSIPGFELENAQTVRLILGVQY